ncbi:hydrid cluster protein-associated redox disulfide domain protein [Pseudolabrys sp. Root1462]|uniref:DUF1858 domain-containing protein n=1 Tax=Pseudolabrys sp. Root1462 TaxID=1736466 RepID=UPI0007153E3B|nr:DUF1858 domain-containing protein [Pseudolabrys sp. Root1462]KQZ02306.1 hydrid cluster protein-associated redox disulfide domain protein [Pseudolabrys sp. Root1462]
MEDIQSESFVGDVMHTWPATIRVFLDFRMGCVGCPIAPFHTIRDSCEEYGIETATFLAALNRARAVQLTSSPI